MACYSWMNKNVVPSITEGRTKKKKSKSKMSVGESFKFLASQRYIRNMAFLVIGYGISINLVEVTWKSKLKAQFSDPNAYSMFMGNFSSATGTVTLLLMLMSQFIFRKFGWGFAALITPITLFITGVMFFALVLGGDAFAPALGAINPILTPLLAACLVGAAQNVFSKGAKYSLFDPCKEMAYIPLEEEVRIKGKGAIDVICNPLGKSGGALIQ